MALIVNFERVPGSLEIRKNIAAIAIREEEEDETTRMITIHTDHSDCYVGIESVDFNHLWVSNHRTIDPGHRR